MKTLKSKSKLPQVIKVRNKLHLDEVWYTCTDWTLKDIEGVSFIPVVRNYPDMHKTQQIHYMKKDNMEYLK
jgi:hypothetical protein